MSAANNKLPTGNKSELPPGTLEQLDLKGPVKWELTVIEPYGRCLVATDDIREGEVLFADQPIVTGPKLSCEPLCLGCYKPIDMDDTYKCSKCGWPLCGAECESSGYHPLECGAFAPSGYKPSPSDFSEDNPMYECVLPLRCLLMREEHPQKWDTLMAMESHDGLRIGTELWDLEQKNVCDFLRERVKLKQGDELMHRVTGVLDVNCFEVRSSVPDTKAEIRVRGVYPLCGMMSHSCSSNTHHTVMDGMVMLVVASRDICKGTQITGTYTHLLSGTIERRKHLKYGKFFDCVCDRCKDPTEFGTFFSALQCSKNKCGGNIIPQNPLHPENLPDFKCQKCDMDVRCGIVNRLTNMIYTELQNIPDNDPVELEMIIRKYQGVLHPNHYHMIGMKHTLGQIYGRVKGYMIGDLSASQLQRKIDCCRDLLWVVDKIDPGISRLRGLTVYELHAPLLLRANRSFQNQTTTKADFLDILIESLGLLSACIRCLQFEPAASFEGQICKIARGSRDELSKWVETVEGLPHSRFLPPQQNKMYEQMTLANLLKEIEEY